LNRTLEKESAQPPLITYQLALVARVGLSGTVRRLLAYDGRISLVPSVGWAPLLLRWFGVGALKTRIVRRG
jgi:ABC-type nitrate/sulfonate/bicarbonate transport system permease component